MPRRRSDSTALQIVAQERPPSMSRRIATAKRYAPAATTVASYPIEPAGIADKKGWRVGTRFGSRGTSITAAAAPLNGETTVGGRKQKRRRRRGAEKWQTEVWTLRDEVGELRFLGDRLARSASLCRIYIGHHKAGDVGDPERVTEGIVGDLAQDLFGNLPDVEQKIKRYTQHLVFTGESNVWARDTDDEGTSAIEWSVHSSTELTGAQSGQYQITDGVTPVKVSDDDILVRSWTPHPQLSALADAPVRALLPVLRELVQMTKYVGAQIDSVLTNGLLLVSQNIEVLTKDGARVPFTEALVEYMIAAVEDRASAESLAPLVALVPGNPKEVAELIKFGGDLDPHMHERRAEAIRRIALGMDSDPLVLEGGGAANHWSAWAVEEGELKLGIAPIVTVFCHTMTQEVVRPLLAAAGVENADEFSVWFDASALKLRPDRSKDAQWAYEQGILSAEKTLVEVGFDEGDMPDDEERTRRILQDNLPMLLSQFGQQAGAAVEILRALGVDIPATAVPDTEAATPAADTPAAPADDPTNSPPDTLGDAPPSTATITPREGTP